MIKVILFDLDDTLISEEEYVKSGYRCVAKNMSKHLGEEPDKVYLELLSLYMEDKKNVFNRLCDKYNVQYTKEDIMQYVKEYREHIPQINFYKDVIPTINELHERGIKTGIISDGYLSTQTKKAEVLEIYKYFEKVIFTESLGREFWKPHPKAFELMKEYFQVKFEQIMYVGDNPEKDFWIKKVYPITTVRIIRNNSVYRKSIYREGIKEDYTIKECNDIITNIVLK